MNINHTCLRALLSEIVARAGSDGDEPRIVADHLVEANLTGHDSHGAQQLPRYIAFLQAGELFANRHVDIVRDEGATLVLDGCFGYGQVIGAEAMDLGIARAKEHGVAVLALRNSAHLCRIGFWGERCARAGLISMHHVNVTGIEPIVAPYRGSDARFATNPYCCTLPGTDDIPPIVLDMATSVVAGGKVRLAHNRKELVREGALIDHRGQPTRDPGVLFGQPMGAIRPIGAHKGYGLAVMNELLAGVLSGGGTIRRERVRPPHYPIINAMLSIIIDPARLVGADFYGQELESEIEWIKASPPADPSEPVLLPGEPERLIRAERLEAGIPLPPAIWAQLVATGESVGLPRTEAARMAGVAGA